MKHALSKLILMTLFLAPLSLAHAQILPPIGSFNGDTGILELPFVVVNGRTHYVEMSLDDPETLTFRVEVDTLVDIHPDGRNTGKNITDIVGEWDFTEDGVTHQLTINEDGTFIFSNAADDDENCP